MTNLRSGRRVVDSSVLLGCWLRMASLLSPPFSPSDSTVAEREQLRDVTTARWTDIQRDEYLRKEETLRVRQEQKDFGSQTDLYTAIVDTGIMTGETSEHLGVSLEAGDHSAEIIAAGPVQPMLRRTASASSVIAVSRETSVRRTEESVIERERLVKTYRAHSEEHTDVITGWDVVERDQWTATTWDMDSRESSYMQTLGVTERSVFSAEDIQKREQDERTLERISEISREGSGRSFGADAITHRGEVTKQEEYRQTTTVRPESRTEIASVDGIHEYGYESQSSSVVMSRLSRPISQMEEAESVQNISRGLGAQMRAAAARNERTGAEFALSGEADQLGVSRDMPTAQRLQDQSAMRAPTDVSMKTAEYIRRSEERERTEKEILMSELLSAEQRLKELSNISGRNIADLSVVERDALASMTLKQMQSLASQLRTSAATIETTGLEGRFRGGEPFVQSDFSVDLTQRETLAGRYGIDEAASQQHLSGRDASQGTEIVRTTSQTELTAKKFHEFGEEEADSVLIMSRKPRRQASADAEHQQGLPRSVVEKLSTKAATVEDASIQGELQGLQENMYAQQVARTVLKSDSFSSMKAATEESVQFGQGLSKGDIVVTAQKKFPERVAGAESVQLHEFGDAKTGFSSNIETIDTDQRAAKTFEAITTERAGLSTLGSTVTSKDTTEAIRAAEQEKMAGVSMKERMEEVTERGFKIEQVGLNTETRGTDKDLATSTSATELQRETAARRLREYGDQSETNIISLARIPAVPKEEEAEASKLVSRSARTDLSTSAAQSTQITMESERVCIPRSESASGVAADLVRSSSSSTIQATKEETVFFSEALSSRTENEAVAQRHLREENKSSDSARLREFGDSKTGFTSTIETVDTDQRAAKIFGESNTERAGLDTLGSTITTKDTTETIRAAEQKQIAGLEMKEKIQEETERRFKIEQVGLSTETRGADETLATSISATDAQKEAAASRVREYGDQSETNIVSLARIPAVPREETAEALQTVSRSVKTDLSTGAPRHSEVTVESERMHVSRSESTSKVAADVVRSSSSSAMHAATEENVHFSDSFSSTGNEAQAQGHLREEKKSCDSASLREFGDKKAGHIFSMETVDVDQRTTETWKERETGRIDLSTAAVQSVTSEVVDDIRAAEFGMGTKGNLPPKMEEEAARQFRIEQAAMSKEASQVGPRQDVSGSASDRLKESASERFREFGESSETNAVSLSRIPAKQPQEEEAWMSQSIGRTYSTGMSAPAPGEVTTTVETQKSISAPTETVTSVTKEILRVESSSSLKATTEETTSYQEGLSRQGVSNGAERQLADRQAEAVQLQKLKEFGQQKSGLLSSMETVDTAQRTAGMWMERSEERMTMSLRGVTEEDSVYQKELRAAEAKVSIGKSLSEKVVEQADEKFGISQIQGKSDLVQGEQHLLAEKVRELKRSEEGRQTVREFGDEREENALSLSRIPAKTPQSEHVEMSQAVSRNLGTDFSTQAAKTEGTAVDIAKTAMEQSQESITVSSLVQKSSSSSSLKASTQETVSVGSDLSKAGTTAEAMSEIQQKMAEDLRSVKIREYSEMRQGLMSSMETVESDLTAEGRWNETRQEKVGFRGPGTTSEEMDHLQEIRAIERCLETGEQLPQKVLEEAQRIFQITQAESGTFLTRNGQQLTTEEVRALLGKEGASQNLREFGDVREETTTVLSRIPVKQLARKHTETSQDIPRNLSLTMKTKAAEETSTSLEAEQRAKESAQEAIFLSKEITKSSNSSALKAATEENVFYGQDLKQAEQTREAGKGLVGKTSEGVKSPRFREYSEERSLLMSNMKTVVTDDATAVTWRARSEERGHLSTRAASVTSIDSMNAMVSRQGSADADFSIPLRRTESSSRGFGIAKAESSTTIAGRAQESSAAEVRHIGPTAEATSTAREFGDSNEESTLVMSRIPQGRPPSGYAETTRDIGRRLTSEASMRASQDSGVDMSASLNVHDVSAEATMMARSMSKSDSTTSLLASREESVSFGTNFQRRDDSSETAQQLAQKALSQESSRLKEYVEAHGMMMGSLETIQTEDATMGFWKEKSTERAGLDTRAVTSASAEASVEICGKEQEAKSAHSLAELELDDIHREFSVRETRGTEAIQAAQYGRGVSTSIGREEMREYQQLREQGHEEESSSIMLTRLSRSGPQAEYADMARPVARSASTEFRTSVQERQDLAAEARITGREQTREITETLKIVQKSSSLSSIQASTSETVRYDRAMGRQEQVEQAEQRLTAANLDSTKSREIREFLSEDKAMMSQWDVVDRDLLTEVMLKEINREQMQLRTASAGLEQSDLTRELSSRNQVCGEDVVLSQSVREQTQTRFTVDSREEEIALRRREEHEREAEYIRADTVSTRESSQFREFGDEETELISSFARLMQRRAEHAEVYESLPDVSTLTGRYDTRESSVMTTSMDSEMERFSQQDQSAALFKQRIMQHHQQHMRAATEECATAETKLRGSEEDYASAGATRKQRHSIADTRSFRQAGEEGALAGYTTITTDMADSRTFALTNRAMSAASLRAAEEHETSATTQIGRGDVVRMAEKRVPMQTRESQERKFHIELTQSEAFFDRDDETSFSETRQSIQNRDIVTSKMTEYGDESTQICSLFGKIIQRKHEIEEVEDIIPIPRRWLETLWTAAASQISSRGDTELKAKEFKEDAYRKIVEVNKAIFAFSALASAEDSTATTGLFNKGEDRRTAELELRTKSREAVQKKLDEQQWNLQSTAAEWATLMADLDAELTRAEKLQATMTATVRAPTKSDRAAEAALARRENIMETSTSFPLQKSESTSGKFVISTGVCQLEMSKYEKEMEDVERFVDEISREEAPPARFRQYGSEKAEGGIYLIRKPLPRVKESSTHVISLNTSLQQSLSAMAAADISTDSNVEIRLPEARTSVALEKRQARTETATLATASSKELSTEVSTTWSKANQTEGSKTTAVHKERIRAGTPKLKEVGRDETEILSLYEGIETDLEAEVQFSKSNKANTFLATMSCSEEVETLNRHMALPEEDASVESKRSVRVEDRVGGVFSDRRAECVASSFVAPTHTETAAVVWADKLAGEAEWRGHEMGDATFNALINLHRYELQKRTQRSEAVLPERIVISAQPIYIKPDEEDVVWSQHHLLRTPSAKDVTRLLRIGNREEPQRVKLLEAGDEKASLKVELIGKASELGKAEKAWPEARKGEGLEMEMEEFGDESALLYGDLNNKQIHLEEADRVVDIARVYTPALHLKTLASKEEQQNVTADWNIPDQKEVTDRLVVIARHGEPLTVRLTETREDNVGLGIAFNQPETGLNDQMIVKGKRDGGVYSLKTQAASETTKDLTSTLSKTADTAQLMHVQKEKISAKQDISVLAAGSVVADYFTELDCTVDPMQTNTLRVCPREEAAEAKFIESQENVANVYYDMNKKDSVETRTMIRLIPNVVEPLELKCDAAEEAETRITSELMVPGQFLTSQFKVVDKNRLPPVTLATKSSTRESTSVSTNLSKSGSNEKSEIMRKEKKRGEPLVVKMKESREEKHTVYQDYEQAAQTETVSFTQQLKREGGRYTLRTDASEEHSMHVTRELEKDRLAVVHSERLNVLSNRAEGVSLSTLSAVATTTHNDVKLSRPEPQFSVSKTLVEKRSERLEMRVLETAENTENIHSIYNRVADAAGSDMTWKIPRDGGALSLKTRAAGSEDAVINTEMEKSRLKEAKTDRKVIIATGSSPAMLRTMATSEVRSSFSQEMVRSGENEVVKRTFPTANQGIDISFRCIETISTGTTVNQVLSRQLDAESQAITIKTPRLGGAVKLDTYFARSTQTEYKGHLLCPRPSDLEASKTTIIRNTAQPLSLSTKGTTSLIASVNTNYARQEETFAISKTLAAANEEKQKLRVAEAAEEQENINCNYVRETASQKTDRIWNEKRKGGVFTLSTRASTSSDENVVCDLKCPRPSELDTEKTYWIARKEAGVTLGGWASTAVEEHVVFDKTIPEPKETAEIVKKWPNRGESLRFTARETKDEIENVALQLRRKEFHEEASLVRDMATSVEPALLEAAAASSRSWSVDAALKSKEVFVMDALIVVKDCNRTDNPLMHCSCSTEASSSAAFALVRSAETEATRVVKEAAVRGPSVAAALLETSEASVSTNFVSARDEHRDAVSETFKEARQGGKFVHNAVASRAEDVQFTFSLDKKVVSDLQTDLTKKIDRRSEPAELFASSSKDETTGTSSQLQKNDAKETTEVSKDAPRRGEDVSTRIAESTSVEETNNMQWKRDEEREEKEVTVKMAGFGGSTRLDAGAAEENSMNVAKEMNRPEHKEAASLERKIANEEKISSMLTAAGEEGVVKEFALANPRPSQDQTEVTKKCAFKGEGSSVRISESAEEQTNSNFALQRETKVEEAAGERKEARYGGGSVLKCGAASEARLDEVVATLAKREAFEEGKVVKKTAREDKLNLVTKAAQSEETSLDSTVTSKGVSEGQAEKVLAEAITIPGTGLKSTQSEETIFHLNYSYDHQPTTACTCRTCTERLKDEGGWHTLTTAAAGNERLELEEVNVSRRMVEVQIEGVVSGAARESSPVLLYAEAVQETVVQVEQSLEKVELREHDERRTDKEKR